MLLENEKSNALYIRGKRNSMRYKLPEKKEEILKRVGNISQIAGAKRYYLADGRGAGIECVDVRTGTGFVYTVMPGRGMDIGWCGFEGMPISYISKAGISAPSYFTGVKDQWLQCFPGGMLSTCGLGNVGDYCEDFTEGLGQQTFGLHGRISNQCAGNVCVNERWDKDTFVMEVSGMTTEAQLRGENFSLHRTVTGKLGGNCFVMKDIITNEDFVERPYMVMYHINFGYPIVDKDAKIIIRSKKKFADTKVSIENMADAYKITDPVNGIEEELYFHQTKALNEKGFAAVVNDNIEAMAYVRYTANTLPYLTEWKMMGDSDYVVGLEAGNCFPRGRRYHREKGLIKVLSPGESTENELEIGVVVGKKEIVLFLEKEDIKN